MKEKQKEIIRCFYKEFLSGKSDKIGCWILAGIVEFVYVVFMWIPFEEIKDWEMFWSLMLIGVIGPYFYLLPYKVFSEDGKQQHFSKKLEYLPVEKRLINAVCVEKLIIFVLKLFLIIAVGQIISSLLVVHRLSIWHLIYLPFYGLIVPLIVGLPVAYMN